MGLPVYSAVGDGAIAKQSCVAFYQYFEILRKTFTHTNRVTLICQVTASLVRKIECLNSASETFLVLQTTIRRPKKQEKRPDVSNEYSY